MQLQIFCEESDMLPQSIPVLLHTEGLVKTGGTSTAHSFSHSNKESNSPYSHAWNMFVDRTTDLINLFWLFVVAPPVFIHDPKHTTPYVSQNFSSKYFFARIECDRSKSFVIATLCYFLYLYHNRHGRFLICSDSAVGEIAWKQTVVFWLDGQKLSWWHSAR